ncbi:MAG: ribonuclease III [Atopobiaceae bacterium]|nr:ribonuclease III [Atopobiaceae bacterium]MDO4404101.1 ribonuclease III [Atopobiaceae bacterium]
MKLHKRVKRIEEIVGHHFDQENLVISAITHPSAAEGKSVSASYERLEFLGDSVLGAMIANDLYTKYPSMDEGQLSMLKIALVSGEMLSEVAGELGVGELILFGESEKGTGARGLRSALENVYEALVGALYVDGGYDVAHDFVVRTLHPRISPGLGRRIVSAKSRLQEVIQRDYHCGPVYKLEGEAGPAHSPTFTSVVLVDGRRVGRGSGATKKLSQASAAADALMRMGYEEGEPNPKEGSPCI